MLNLLLRRCLLAAACWLLGSRVSAQELSLLGGAMSTHDAHLSTYGWQLDYRQNLTRYVAASVAYLNEGHVPNHHRDGTLFEAWVRLPLFHDQLALSAGAGADYYYDTQPVSAIDSLDVHGLAPVYSLSATAQLPGRWFLKGVINHVNPKHDIRTTTTLVGVGFWFGRERKPTKGKLGDAPEEDSYVTENEITAFGGQSIVNTMFSQKSFAYGAEYRRGIIPHIDWTMSAIYEGNPQIVRRNGLATQGWLVNTFFNRRVSVGIGLGPYFYVDRRHPTGKSRWNPAAAAPLVSLTAVRKLSDHWLLRATFNRVTTDYDRDADVILIGAGYSWR